MIRELKAWLGVEVDEVGWREKLLAGFGALVAVAATLYIGRIAFGPSGALALVPSMGATAVLLFAVPLGQLSQPWPVLGGHAVGALVGVTCAKLLPPGSLVAAGCAVGGAIVVMRALKCLHPPGGATALFAVIGGPAIWGLGYSLLWYPVMLNACVLLLLTALLNWPFPWRKYPAHFHRMKKETAEKLGLTHEAVVEAVRSIDSFVDITEDELLRLYEALSQRRTPPRQVSPRN